MQLFDHAPVPDAAIAGLTATGASLSAAGLPPLSPRLREPPSPARRFPTLASAAVASTHDPHSAAADTGCSSSTALAEVDSLVTLSGHGVAAVVPAAVARASVVSESVNSAVAPVSLFMSSDSLAALPAHRSVPADRRDNIDSAAVASESASIAADRDGAVETHGGYEDGEQYIGDDRSEPESPSEGESRHKGRRHQHRHHPHGDGDQRKHERSRHRRDHQGHRHRDRKGHDHHAHRHESLRHHDHDDGEPAETRRHHHHRSHHRHRSHRHASSDDDGHADGRRRDEPADTSAGPSERGAALPVAAPAVEVFHIPPPSVATLSLSSGLR